MQAAAWAAELASLCGQRGDPRAGLEAEAYTAWMAGIHDMERGHDWQAALASLQRSKCVPGFTASNHPSPSCALWARSVQASLCSNKNV